MDVLCNIARVATSGEGFFFGEKQIVIIWVKVATVEGVVLDESPL